MLMYKLLCINKLQYAFGESASLTALWPHVILPSLCRSYKLKL